ncbi:MAG: ATP-binding protein [Symbiobacteriaceae bacterium]|nr:ATP-binding protein [Symbiobacteriaceae bacterium]
MDASSPSHSAREIEKLLEDLAKQDQLLKVINTLAIILLSSAQEENFESSLLEGMELIGRCLEADCVQIWGNEPRDDELHFVLKHKWLSEEGEAAPHLSLGTALPYSQRWLQLFAEGENINGPVSTLAPEDREFLAHYGFTSTITIPLYYKDEFWGVFCVDDYVKERYFAEDEIGILNSAALMLVNAINRNAQNRQISDTAARLQAVVANYPGAICSADKDFVVTIFDGSLVPHLVDREVFQVGQNLYQSLNGVEYGYILENLKRTVTFGPQDWSFDAHGKVMHVTTTPIFDARGEAAGFMAKIEDISELAQIQRELEVALDKANSAVFALEMAQQTTSAMFESNPQINILFNDAFQAIDCNPAAVSFLEFPSKEVLLAEVVQTITDSIPIYQPDGELSISLSQSLNTAARDGYIKLEGRVILQGEERTVGVEFRKIPYENSFAIVCYIHDLTEIHQRELELIHTREQYKIQLAKLNLVLEATHIGLWDMEINADDPVGSTNAIVWSDRFRRLLGFDNEEEFPNTVSTFEGLLHPEDLEATHNALRDHILDRTGQTPFDIEYRAKRKNGEYGFFHSAAETFRDDLGNPIRVAGAIMDITETKNLIQEIETQRQEAEAANRAKSSFLSTMSHEIRTPMNAIIGIAEIQLQNEELDAPTRDALNKIYASGDLLLGIINDILDLSKIEAGKLELMLDNYDIASLVSDTAHLNIMRMGSKHIEFELNVAENVPNQMAGDPLRIKQILNNLLSNAFKYTQAGTVALSFAVEDTAKKEEITLVFKVSDTCQGMTKEQISRLFDEYARFNMEANRSTEGTGLGMSITRNLVSLMNGEIAVISELGVGSTFTVRLPQGRVATATPLGKDMVDNLRLFRSNNWNQLKRVQINREPMPYGSVLIVDDVETNIYVARGLLAPYGLKIEVAASGYEAIEFIHAGKEYDVIFMDHMMPGMDGLEATKIMRELGYQRSIVALTANAVAGQADLFLANGFDDFISKPIDVRALNAVLNKLIRDKQSAATLQEARGTAALKHSAEKATTVSAAINPRFIPIFLRDASRTLEVLAKFTCDEAYEDPEEFRSYLVSIHGIKSALGVIGQQELSGEAARLEMAGREGKVGILAAETPAFVSALRELVSQLQPETKEVAGEEDGADREYLLATFQIIIQACQEYNKRQADLAIAELHQRAWSEGVEKLLQTISQQLLHGEFEAVSAALEQYTAPGGGL